MAYQTAPKPDRSTGRCLTLHRLPADVSATETLGPPDAVDGLIGPRLRFADAFALRRDIQHPSAVGGDPAPHRLGAGVENLDAFDLRRLLQPFDRRAALVVARIAL